MRIWRQHQRQAAASSGDVKKAKASNIGIEHLAL